jgi:hypothetical protein
MSKKELLSETQIRRFMKLANLEPLTTGVLSEMGSTMDKMMDRETMGHLAKSEAAAPEMAMDAEQPALPAGEESAGAETVEVGGDVDPEKQAAFEAAVKALADSMGIEVELEGQEEHAEEAGEEMHDLGGEEGEEEGDEEEDEEEEMQEAKMEEEEEELDEAKKEEEDEEQQDEAKKLSEDDLVEAVLARVTARLVAEAKKKKMTVKQKMKMKKAEKKADKKEEKMDEATEAKGGGPLLSKGGQKTDVWKGTPDMEYKEGKEGKGGHEMKDLPAKAEHTVTHGGKNLATMGGNKKK